VRSGMKTTRRLAFEREVQAASDFLRQRRHTDAFRALERAHVLGQDEVITHVRTHVLMLRIEAGRGNMLAALGQAARIILGAIGSAIGVIPLGNTGGTNVSMFNSIPIAPDLVADMRGDVAHERSATRVGTPVRSLLTRAIAFIGSVALGAVLYAYAPELLRTSSTQAPMNFVPVSERIHTSGQPSPSQLSGLHEKGYELVVNLAPPTSAGSVAEEGMLVAQAGATYVNIPVDWHAPRYEDFVLFSDLLDRAGPRRTLVHCQINKRASLFTFLYRVVREGANPDAAYANVTAIWAPDEQWANFAREVLKRHGIEFDPY
jgi:protein tyrosine phosphatase (PTP) superfamily phosphohydrolase (DUF442 family)